jgi:hypothetical protein
MKSVLAVVAGMVLWGVLWVGGTQGLMAVRPELQPGEPITGTAVLAVLIGYSVVLSIMAGWVAARLAPKAPVGHAAVLAAIQLAIGIAVQASAWTLFPVWYHVIFLGLVVPATVYGGTLGARVSSRAPR